MPPPTRAPSGANAASTAAASPTSAAQSPDNSVDSINYNEETPPGTLNPAAAQAERGTRGSRATAGGGGGGGGGDREKDDRSGLGADAAKSSHRRDGSHHDRRPDGEPWEAGDLATDGDDGGHDHETAALIAGHGGPSSQQSQGRPRGEGGDRDGGGGAEDRGEDNDDDMSTWSGRAAIKGSSETMRMILLTCNSVGMTFTWGVEMTYCTPYLLSLGLTKGQTSLVWLAGPLSGLVVQPIVGVISDGSKSKWGRRRPFIMACSVIVALSLLTLGFTRDIVGLFVSMPPPATSANGEPPAPGSGGGVGSFLTIALAVLALYTTDFAINAVMSCSRSLIVDTLPIQKQQTGAAWSGRMASIGHLVGYGAGAVDLVAIFGTGMGDTQFKKLTILAACGILAFSGITCWAVSERVLISEGPQARRGGKPERFKVFRQIWSTLLTLPPRIQGICWAVFWSWIGWFPFLIYSSTWVGETYFRYDVPADAKDSKDALGDMGRIGSYALTIYSVVTFLAAWLLPPLVRSPDDSSGGDIPDQSAARQGQGQGPLAILHRRYPNLARLLARFDRAKPDLLTVWFFGHLMFSAAMSLAPFAASFRFATALVAICGVPWIINMWAPTALLGVEVNRLTGGGGSTDYRRLSTSSLEFGPLPRRGGHDGGDAADHEDAMVSPTATDAAAAAAPASGRGSGGGGGELSGVYFGILNIYVTLPQFVGTLISTIVFAVLEPGKSPELSDSHPSEHHPTDGPNAIAVCLFIGAISAIGAAYATARLRRI